MLILLAFMKCLLILLYFLTNNVEGCLVVNTKNPNMRNCKCSINLFNQNDIRKNKGGKYLSYQQAWDPIVSTNDTCSVSITCNPIAGVSSFMTVMFRSNGNPIYINRVVSGQSTYLPQPRSISVSPITGLEVLRCHEEDDGTHQWYYHGSPLSDLSFSCIADEDSCKCPTIAIGGDVLSNNRLPSDPNRCGYFNASCERPATEGTMIPYLSSADTYAITGGSSSSVHQYDELMCLKEEDGAFNWYFANLRLPNPRVKCASDVDTFGEAQLDTCGNFKRILKFADLEPYHRKGNYENAVFGSIHELSMVEFAARCGVSERAVVFSENSDPIQVTGYDGVFCLDHPLDSKVKMWIANGTRLINPAVACVNLELFNDNIRMNGCQCPQLKHIDSSGISKMDYLSEWLSRKTTIRPWVQVNSNCEVSFNAAPFANSDFQFMLFRDKSPPIFMRRFLANEAKPEKVVLSDFICRNVNDKYQWYYGNSRITDRTLYVAAQVNPGSCTCNDIVTGPGMTITKANGTCDMLHFRCDNDQLGIKIEWKPIGGSPSVMVNHEVVRGFSNEMTLVEANCFFFDWRIHGEIVSQVSASCADVKAEDSYYYDSFASKCPCNKPEFFKVPEGEDQEEFWEIFGTLYPWSEKYKNRTKKQLKMNVTPKDCYYSFECFDSDDTLVVFSMGARPMVFLPGNYPDMRCVSPPVAQNLKTEKYWWIDNRMVSMPKFACFARIDEIDDSEIDMNECSCPPVNYIDQEGIRSLGSESSYLAGKETRKPKITVSKDCRISVDSSHLGLDDFNIVLYRKEAPPLYMRRFTTPQHSAVQLNDLVCNQEGDVHFWEYEGGRVSKDPISLAVQLNTGACSCESSIGNLYPSDPQFNVTVVNGICDNFQVQCPQGIIYLLKGDLDLSITMGSYQQFAGLVCIDSVLYFNEAPSDMPFPYVFRFGWANAYPELEEPARRACQCNTIYSVHERDREFYISEFDKNGLLDDRSLVEGVGEYMSSTCEYVHVCPDDYEIVTLSAQRGVKIVSAHFVFFFYRSNLQYESKKSLRFKCVNPPVAQNEITEKYWWVEEYMIAVLSVTCAKKLHMIPIEMNGCPCPQINYIDQIGIQDLGEESSWLGSKETVMPKLSVSSACVIHVDKWHLNINDNNIVLFRNGAPPIFMRRFPGQEPFAFDLDDLVCTEKNGAHAWEYKKGGLVSNGPISISVLLNTGSCSCEKVKQWTPLTITENSGVCDDLQLECPTPGNWIMLGHENEGIGILFSSPIRSANVICADGQWYSNGYPLYSPTVQCLEPVDVFKKDFIEACRCYPVLTHNKESYNSISKELDKKNILSDRIFDAGEGENQVSSCEFSYVCPADYEPVVFSQERDPKIFPIGETLHLKCVDPPFAHQGLQKTDKFWWSGDLMESFVQVTCVKKTE
ncbi:hypothetical protein B9Z55_002758 [Caenorhabditis nigoni]|nr:hypothetical protein B9Z55_002758 [Caenorhabditis nigoni]